MDRRDIEFPDKDLPLRRDVSTLGALVGEVVAEQEGPELYEAVEAARRLAIARRQGEDGAEESLADRLAGRSPTESRELARAFAAYFQVVNLAEQVHRIRRRREYLRDGGGAQRESLEEAVALLAKAGLGAAEVGELFRGLRVEPVFTAHPTQATRRLILEKEQRIVRRLVERLDPAITRPEAKAAIERIRAEIAGAWQTELHPALGPTVLEEREQVLFYLTEVLYRIVPPFCEALEDAFDQVYAGEADGIRIVSPIRFASWVGGDMDGNPNVSADTIRQTLVRQRGLILAAYRREALKIARVLTQSRARVPASPEVEDLLEQHRALLPETAEAIAPRHRGMPYLGLLTLIAARLEATAEDGPGAFSGPAELFEALRVIARSLGANRGRHAGLFAVRRFLRRVETFGFHLATLDVRQDAQLHRRVMGRLLGDADWESRPSAERAERLGRELAGAAEAPALDPEADPESDRVLEVFRAIGDGRRIYGPEAVGPFIISMAQGVDDVFTVLLLARWAGLGGAGESVPLDVAPLFETVPDLEAAPDIVGALAADPGYRRHLAARDDRQVVMIGYSDSNKDGGLAASRWALQRGQAALGETLAPTGIRLVLFHGSGGTISRGGGKIYRAVRAAPPGTVQSRMRITQQGEVIHQKYGVRSIALRSLERMVGAVGLATAQPPAPDPRGPAWEAILDRIAERSRESYRALVYEEPDFFEYFRTATPIDVIERMRIGSRPASRRAQRGIQDLRAIPWVFAWTQSRHILPGWFGLGSGLEAACAEFGEDAVAEMARDWPFADNLLDDAEMVLAKADPAIACRYAGLAGKIGERIFPRIREEFDRTVRWILALRGADTLLERDPTLRRSILLRNPYVDPLSFLQIDLLRRWRRSERQDDELFRALLSTVYGIAQGLKNTG